VPAFAAAPAAAPTQGGQPAWMAGAQAAPGGAPAWAQAAPQAPAA
jgi:hypothetical protein